MRLYPSGRPASRGFLPGPRPFEAVQSRRGRARALTLALLPILLSACGSTEAAGGDDDAGAADTAVADSAQQDTATPDAVADTAPPDLPADLPPDETMVLRCTPNRVASNPYPRFFEGADRFETTFELPTGVFSFMLQAYDEDGAQMVLDSLTTPDGETLELIGDRDFQLFHSSLWLSEGDVDVMLFPPAPDWVDVVQEGTYTLSGLSASDEFCFWLLSNERRGVELDVNFYFVGVPGLDALSAENSRDWQEVEESLASIYADAEIQVDLDSVAYFDVTRGVEEEYSIIRSQSDVNALVSQSEQPVDDSLDEALRINIFLIRGFAGEMGQVAGISTGIPGAAGLHGTSVSGVVFSTENLLGGNWMGANGNVTLGQIIAHEVGHFLGLFHTTELDGRSSDPIEDTPVCPEPQNVYGCPDYSNLMFPIAAFRDEVVLSSLQAEVIAGNPLVKP